MDTVLVSVGRAAYHVVLKICKLLLTTVSYALVQVVAEACQPETQAPPVTASTHSHAVVLQQALHHLPNPSAECMLRNVAVRLGQHLAEQVKCYPWYDVVRSSCHFSKKKL